MKGEQGPNFAVVCAHQNPRVVDAVGGFWLKESHVLIYNQKATLAVWKLGGGGTFEQGLKTSKEAVVLVHV